MNVLIAGGGTGGHVFPALAVAQQIMAEEGDAMVRFVGAGGMELRAVRAAGFEIHSLDVGRLKGAGWFARVQTIAGLPLAVGKAWRLMTMLAPDLVVGAGGYVSAPVVMAAVLRRLPIVLLEQNAIAGLTNRTLSRLATRVVISYAEAAQQLPAHKTELLGNPLRLDLLHCLAEPQDKPQGPRTPHVLILGGSQGARRINELASEAAPLLRAQFPTLQITHQTGLADVEWVTERYAALGIQATVAPFFEQMGPLYRQATFAISRAGATTLAELAAAGLPALLIPYPHAADQHQQANAAHFVAAQAAVLRDQAQLDVAELVRCVVDIHADPARREAMAAAMRREGRPDAAQQVVALLRRLIRPTAALPREGLPRS